VESPVELTEIEGGYRVKETDSHYIEVHRMLFNWRVVTVWKDTLCPDRGWCYHGTGLDSLVAAVAAAHFWDGSDGTEPDGWNKNVQTGERRWPPHGGKRHFGAFTCPACGWESSNEGDKKYGYCGNCHEFTGGSNGNSNDADTHRDRSGGGRRPGRAGDPRGQLHPDRKPDR